MPHFIMRGTLCICSALMFLCICTKSSGFAINNKKDVILPFKWDFDLPVENQRLLPLNRPGKGVEKIKRPFCNAFTGCGRKRSAPEPHKLDPSDVFPVYKALLFRTRHMQNRPMN